MDWLVGSCFWLALCAVQLASGLIVWPIVRLYAKIIFYGAGIYLLKILIKLRYEVYNQDLKYSLEECKRKVVVITGATSGIGLAASKFLHSRGFVIIACYYCKQEPGFSDLENIIDEDTGQSLFLVELDVRSQESIEKCQQQVRAILDSNRELQFHALINVAGVGYIYKFQWQPRHTIKALLETNLVGPVMMAREFLPLLIKSAPDSRLVNVSSPLAKFSVPYNTVYGATKAGLTHFTNTLWADAAGYGLKTVAIHPGNVIRNTTIIHSSLQTDYNKLLEALTDEERQLYGPELLEHEKFRQLMNRVKQKPIDLRLDLTQSISKNLKRLGFILAGSLDDPKLELSHLMNSFENAVRMKNPTREMFAGNQFFEIIIGAFFEVISGAFLRDVSQFFAKRTTIPRKCC